MSTFTESEVEAAALDWLQALGWRVAHGPDFAPLEHFGDRNAPLPGLTSGNLPLRNAEGLLACES